MSQLSIDSLRILERCCCWLNFNNIADSRHYTTRSTYYGGITLTSTCLVDEFIEKIPPRLYNHTNSYT